MRVPEENSCVNFILMTDEQREGWKSEGGFCTRRIRFRDERPIILGLLV